MRRFRNLRKGLAIATGAAFLIAAALRIFDAPIQDRVLGPLNAGLVRLQQDFRPSPVFTLFDSLPALSSGLSSLEAFSLTLPPGTPANAERSLWLTRTIDTVRFAFHTERDLLDSTTLYLWAGDTVHRKTLRRRGSFDWYVPTRRRVTGWSEVVGVYASFPPRIRVRARDPSISVFERVEGAVLHGIADSYSLPRERPMAPDTLYPSSADEGVMLLARGSNLAVMNPGRRMLRVRLLRLDAPSGRSGRASTLLAIPAGTVQVYRGLLDRSATYLAYTGAGEPLCLLGRCRAADPEFFRLGAASSNARAEAGE